MASSGGVQLALAPNYLRQFRDSSSLELRRLSAVQFMAVWEHYDTDGGVTSKAVNKISWNVHNFLRKIRKSRSQQISENKEESQVWDKGSLLTKPSNGNRFFNSRHFPKGGGPSRVLLWMLQDTIYYKWVGVKMTLKFHFLWSTLFWLEESVSAVYQRQIAAAEVQLKCEDEIRNYSI